ncbi:MAG: pyrimidine-nucleoside phosphorylase [Clostridia bacterium]|nr:pyrimidine-nucleoside phosphorylase [Lachnospiraceae bacterium]NCB99375.1 pyrimidine-nucleoside phosphorylase [Clostridia bacterium]NCD01522.1 pyrimidine-nucleoside phosphorylase [Clostridia bacterium]
MRFVDIIEKKRYKKSLTTEEIQWWISRYVEGNIPDYQVSSLLMAIVLNGMDVRETADLTMAMMHSGDVIDLSPIQGIKVDKHSTGGVGDKTTLALGPMLAACGAKVAKMSGRGLGYTGGTLDKLESIRGFNCYLDKETFIHQVNTIGIGIIGQTAQLVPADKKLYALRDVTGTVASIPLIASSIMSKKLAAGTDVIDLDVKYGSGAFMKTPEAAVELARMMISLGEACGKKVRAMITDMNEPLGMSVGNALEVKEAVDTLRGHGPKDFTELCLRGGAVILLEAGLAESEADGRKQLEKVIADGSGFSKFKEMVKAQGGDENQLEHTELLPKALHVTPIPAREAGYIEQVQALEIGRLAMEIGAGRERKEDTIQPETGIVLGKKTGDEVKKGEVLAWVHHNEPLKQEWMERFYGAFFRSKEPVPEKQLIYKMM